MVRAIDSCTWRDAMFLERVRPGIAISVILHAFLFLALAYYLAFPPSVKPVPAEQEETLTVFDPPHASPPAKPPKDPTFKPQKTIELPNVHPDVPPLVLPPVIDFDKGPTKTTTTETPSAPVITNQRPIQHNDPVYPDRALDQGRAGYVDFNFTIEPDGSVGDLQLVTETPAGFGFAAAAEKAFAKWRFQPKLVNGVPVAARARYRVSFQLK
jgi:protein TonB